MDLFTVKQQIIEASEIAALALARQMGPSFDEVKYKEAIKVAGSKSWLDYHIQHGNIIGNRRGVAKNSPIYYSRLEIAAVRKAETEVAKLV